MSQRLTLRDQLIMSGLWDTKDSRDPATDNTTAPQLADNCLRKFGLQVWLRIKYDHVVRQ
jgi:hypothetical protein